MTGGKDGSPPDLIRRVGAEALERSLVEHLRRLADRPELGPGELSALVQRVELRRADTQLVLEAEALFAGDHPSLALEELQGRLAPGERAVWEAGNRPAIRISLPLRMQLRGGRTRLSGIDADPQPRVRKDAGMITALRSAHAELASLGSSPLTPGPALRHARSPPTQHRRQLARLVFLAPDLQRMILEGRQPAGLNLRTLLKSELQLAWADQRAWFATLRQQQPGVLDG